MFVAAADGFAAGWDSRALAEACVKMGAGRTRKEDPVDPAPGMRLFVKKGDRVTKGMPLLEVHASQKAHRDIGLHAAQQSFRHSETAVAASTTRILDLARDKPVDAPAL